jgi:hypothetical protein
MGLMAGKIRHKMWGAAGVGKIIDFLPASVIWLVCGYHITIATLEKPDKTLAFSDRKEGCPNQH